MEMLGHGEGLIFELWGAHRKSHIHTVIYNNFRLFAPDIVEQVHHDPDSLVPHQSIIFLTIIISTR